jgi:hypothetical protein
MQALPDANAELRSIRGRQRFGSKKKERLSRSFLARLLHPAKLLSADRAGRA